MLITTDLADTEALDTMREQLAMAQAAFNGPHYARMMLDMNFTVLADEMPAAIEAIPRRPGRCTAGIAT